MIALRRRRKCRRRDPLQVENPAKQDSFLQGKFCQTFSEAKRSGGYALGQTESAACIWLFRCILTGRYSALYLSDGAERWIPVSGEESGEMIRLFEESMCSREVYSGFPSGEFSAVREALEQEKIRYRKKKRPKGRESILVRRRDEAQARKLVQLQINHLWREKMRKC